jgi:hypothetical protein
LVLDAGSFLVSEHVQNLARVGLNSAGAIQVVSNSQDPGTRERVWGSPWRSQVAFPGASLTVLAEDRFIGAVGRRGLRRLIWPSGRERSPVSCKAHPPLPPMLTK